MYFDNPDNVTFDNDMSLPYDDPDNPISWWGSIDDENLNSEVDFISVRLPKNPSKKSIDSV